MNQPEIKASMEVTLFSHHVKVFNFNMYGKNALVEYCRNMAQYELVRVSRDRFERQVLRVFVANTQARTEFRFNINVWQDLRRHLARYGFNENNIKVNVEPMYVPRCVKFTRKDLRDDLEFQPPIIDYLVSDGKSQVVTLQTGRGKTRISLRAIDLLGKRTVIVVQGMYIAKWIQDISEFFELGSKELMVVRGSAHLQQLIELALADELESSLILISSKTIFNYLKEYETFGSGESGYAVPPEKFYETLGAGVRLIDEAHKDYHLVFRQDLYAHIPKTISLSATLDSDDPFMNNMYRIQWPLSTRAPEVAYDKYIVVKSLWYSIVDSSKIRYKNIMRQYSHVKFEESILRSPAMLRNYIEMISSIVQTSYIAVREEGQRMIIFCGTIEMCTLVRNHIAKLLPSLTVARYVDNDEYEDLLAADIAVSTIQSAGTAVDIHNLRICLMTTVINSKQSNIQVLGRLRRLKDWPDVTPEFIFISAREIDKHREYARQKAEKLDGKVLGFKEYQTGFRV